MSGEEIFEFAAAIAGVSIGLAAALLLALFAVIGTWRLFMRARDASEATSRAALTVEELARRMAPAAAPAVPAAELEALRQQTAALIEVQRQLEATAQNLIDAAALSGGGQDPRLDDVHAAITRLDTNVGQMAASLANLLQALQRQQPQQR